MPPGHVVKLGLLSKGSEKTGRATGPQLRNSGGQKGQEQIAARDAVPGRVQSRTPALGGFINARQMRGSFLPVPGAGSGKAVPKTFWQRAVEFAGGARVRDTGHTA